MIEDIKSKLKELDQEFTSIFKNVNEELKKIEASIDRGVPGPDTARALSELREKLRNFRSRLVSSRFELRAMLREVRLTNPQAAEELEDTIDDFFDKWEDALEDFLDDMRDIARGLERYRQYEFSFDEIGRVIEQSVQQTARGLELALGKLKDALEKGISGPSYVVSSVRLPQKDVEVIDALVEAGVFKSRSEAVAFFAHKGIESSRSLFNEALEKLEELKRLRERLRDELQKALGEDHSSQG
ncbi:MAG: hypothetical protein NZ954_02520 [Thermofilaceae archaeon]|nr:hypothetical protein [Thermofilaceae archaeon]MCX8181232.1 hypothetical protein [Thermofilaceae archaeon]